MTEMFGSKDDFGGPKYSAADSYIGILSAYRGRIHHTKPSRNGPESTSAADRDGLRTDRESRREPSSPHTFKQHRSSLSSGSVESRMAELDDIQRSMEVEETEEESFEEDRFKSREHYDTDSDSVSSGREAAPYQQGARVQNQQPPSPVETYINNSVSGIDRIPTHEWTFEEQFKQLYELGTEPERKEFLDDLFSFMQKRGTPVNRVPIMAKQTLDLFKLFKLVVEKGGLVEVINKKIWREIIKGLSLPASVTSAAFTLRTQYMKYLYPYECSKKKLSSPAELQAAIDGNRRDSRRSFGSFLSQAVPSDGTHVYNSPSPTTTPPAFTGNSSSPGISHRSSPGPSASNHDVHVPPSVHGNNGVAMLHSPGVVQYSPKRSSSVTEVTSRGVSSSPSDTSPCGSPVKKFAAVNERNNKPTPTQLPWTHIKIQTQPKGMAQSGQFQFPDPERSRGREPRQLPLTLLDQVSDNSLLVSVELNGVVYQGVLFARQNRPDSPKSNEDY
ncbi:AT-rich interactive domain-containing protein 3C-like isoform X2 [Orbicella faveolata]|nr:AT-rich interactive domain-containing protein 3C-like isoform X2 [Orbicella faveolata]